MDRFHSTEVETKTIQLFHQLLQHIKLFQCTERNEMHFMEL